MRILVTGGAGYIGSFMTKALLDRGNTVIVADNISRGNEDAIDARAEFLNGNLHDETFLEKLFSEPFDFVIHFAGYISMKESMENPFLYFQNNTYITLKLLEAMRKSKTKNIIFSSTAGVYGNPETIPIPETHSKHPTNPYGTSKLMVEEMLSWYEKIYGINFVALRYFNACGAALDGSMGELHHPETHIIPLAIDAAIKKMPFMIFGNDYKTDDGTCVRDYIHVLDLVAAHILALEKLGKEQGGFFYNVGTGIGHSNKQVIDMIEKVSGHKVAVEIEVRRPGDADVLVADVAKIKNDMQFIPQYSDLETIVKSAWKWHEKASR
jgi:UDP-glucose 4-epimerase